jgi:hypothetical protein
VAGSVWRSVAAVPTLYESMFRAGTRSGNLAVSTGTNSYYYCANGSFIFASALAIA